MFTNPNKLTAWIDTGVVAAGLTVAASLAQETPPLPHPPLQPMPTKDFKVPKPRLGLPELVPVAQQSDPPIPTNPLPPSSVPTQPESRVLPLKPAEPTGVTLAPGATGDTRLVGKIVRVERDHIVVESSDHKAIIFHFDPQTKILRRDAARVSDLAPGTSITAVYTPRGERYWVTTIDLVPVGPAPTPGAVVVVPQKPVVVVPTPPTVVVPANPPAVATPPVVVPANPPVTVVVPATAYETEIVRVVSPDQIVVRNESGNEFTLFVTSATRYQVGNAAAAFVDFRPGMRIRVDDEVRADRHFARQIVGVRLP